MQDLDGHAQRLELPARVDRGHHSGDVAHGRSQPNLVQRAAHLHKTISFNFGNEIYYTEQFFVIILKHSCSNFH